MTDSNTQEQLNEMLMLDYEETPSAFEFYSFEDLANDGEDVYGESPFDAETFYTPAYYNEIFPYYPSDEDILNEEKFHQFYHENFFDEETSFTPFSYSKILSVLKSLALLRIFF